MIYSSATYIHIYTSLPGYFRNAIRKNDRRKKSEKPYSEHIDNKVVAVMLWRRGFHEEDKTNGEMALLHEPEEFLLVI